MAEESLGEALEAVLAARRRERTRFSARLHDDVGQRLTAVGLELELLKMEPDMPKEELAGKIFKAQESLEAAFQTIREMSYDSHSDPVARFGFEDALRRLIARYDSLYPGRVKSRLHPGLEPRKDLGTALLESVDYLMDFVLSENYPGQVTIRTGKGRDGFVVQIHLAPDPAEIRAVLQLVDFICVRKSTQIRVSTRRSRDNMIKLYVQEEKRGNAPTTW
jgi:hypothetical protein